MVNKHFAKNDFRCNPERNQEIGAAEQVVLVRLVRFGDKLRFYAGKRDESSNLHSKTVHAQDFDAIKGCRNGKKKIEKKRFDLNFRTDSGLPL